MAKKKRVALSKGDRIFDILNVTMLLLFAFLCILPMIHVLAISLSHNSAVMANKVVLWPVRFSTTSYKYVMQKRQFLQSFSTTLQRVAIGLSVNLFLIVLSAYPLSKEATSFKWRTLYAWIFFVTMLFNGGLIPTYMVVKETGLLDRIWALVLPNAIPVFNAILLLNFFRQVPKELEEAAFMDGAGHWRTLFQIYLPVSKPAIATITLYIVVFHWNQWFDGLIYMNRPSNYPLQSYLRTIIIERDLEIVSEDQWRDLAEISNRTIKSAQIFLAAVPVLLVYPFLQRYFVKGMVLGSVKG
jgi:putative aldouronate transport system permease protein